MSFYRRLFRLERQAMQRQLDAEQRHRLLSSHARLGTLLRRLERFAQPAKLIGRQSKLGNDETLRVVRINFSNT